MTQKSADLMKHGQETRGTLASTVGAKAEGDMRAMADAKTLQTLGSLYESERNRTSNAVSQALNYASFVPSVAGAALSGASALSPLATYNSDVANQQSITNANLQSNWTGQQISGYGALSDYGTYYVPEEHYQPGLGDYLLGGMGAIGGLK
jgi:hypothetical protein